MKNVLSAVAAVSIAFATASAASAATFPVGSPNFSASPGPNGTFAGGFFNTGIAEGAFSDTFTFTLPTDGFGSGTVTTSANIFESANDVDFTSVTVNGVLAEITRTEGSLFEVAFENRVAITGGVLNSIVVNGISRGNGAYGGQLSFIPSDVTGAIPEPATWAMMLIGFGGIGAAMRHRRRETVATA